MASKCSQKPGPHGVGDPDDMHLRKVELDILVPKLMREKVRTEKCYEEVENFNKCVRGARFKYVFTCRKENSALWECSEKWYLDEEFKEQCKNQYLKERSEYRMTGISRKDKQRLEGVIA